MGTSEQVRICPSFSHLLLRSPNFPTLRPRRTQPFHLTHCRVSVTLGKSRHLQGLCLLIREDNSHDCLLTGARMSETQVCRASVGARIAAGRELRRGPCIFPAQWAPSQEKTDAQHLQFVRSDWPRAMWRARGRSRIKNCGLHLLCALFPTADGPPVHHPSCTTGSGF